MRSLTLIATLCIALLAGCSSGPRKGGYYQNDGPGRNIPSDLLALPDAKPVVEPFAPANLRPYSVFGVRYVPITESRPFRQEGMASWYGRQFHGNKTANGETYDMYSMTAAHPTLPLPSYARVTRKSTGKSVIVRINDRGPFHPDRIIDLSYAAAAKLDLIGPGSGLVVVEAITHDQIRAGTFTKPAPMVAETPRPQSSAFTAPIIPVSYDYPDTGTSMSDRQFFLQFGAFGTPENAYGLANQLNQQISALEGNVVQVQPAGNVHRVLMGPYPSRDDAVNAATRIRQQTGLQPGIALH